MLGSDRTRRRLTVLFSTRNRGGALAPVLDSFTSLEAPPEGWKLVVVDNGSTDNTAGLLQSYLDRLPLTIMREPRPGKNRALNAALPQLEGSLVVLTDDDVLPRPDWLVQLCRAAEEHPEAALFGGCVLPHWSCPRPPWLLETAVPFSVLYAQQRRDTGPCSYAAIFGPNMAVRASVFAAGFRFSESVGPDETRRMYAMGGETEFLRRLDAAGYRGHFVADAVVGHIIRPEQLDEQWILHRAYRYGIGEGRHYASRAMQLHIRSLVYGLAARIVALLRPSPLRLKIRYKASTLSGIMAGLRNEKAIAGARSAQADAAARKLQRLALQGSGDQGREPADGQGGARRMAP
ncbi:glycosyltransferase [Lichenicoccus sp.]|uniref:glycosyltransferase n=1 Tax=Lichenicoccus sp. TaxID=2781899 RepID=UPI003D0EAD3D